MRYMYKYEVGFHNTVLTMPRNAIIRHAGSQNERCFLWAEVENPTGVGQEERIFGVFATGEEIPDLNFHRWEWRATWQSGPFVWHLFENV